MDTTLSFVPTVDLDLSNKDNLEKSLKAKVIKNSTVNFNNIINQIQSVPFGLEVLFKVLFEKVTNLENEVSQLKKITKDNKVEKNQSYIKKILEIRKCCGIENQKKFNSFQSQIISNNELEVIWEDNNIVKINKEHLINFNNKWCEISAHQCIVMASEAGAVYSEKYYFSFK